MDIFHDCSVQHSKFIIDIQIQIIVHCHLVGLVKCYLVSEVGGMEYSVVVTL